MVMNRIEMSLEHNIEVALVSSTRPLEAPNIHLDVFLYLLELRVCLFLSFLDLGRYLVMQHSIANLHLAFDLADL